MDNAIIIIPARMGAERFQGKPLHNILGKPMILHCLETAKKANIAEVLVACGDEEIYQCVKDNGGTAILTDPALPSGSDRIYSALQQYDAENRYEVIINMQGDLPHLPDGALQSCLNVLDNPTYDVSSLAVIMHDKADINNPDIVKIVMADEEAYAFSRSPVPYGDGDFYHHLGIYGFRRKALERFVALPPSPLEKREKLEQWRILEDGMRIGIAIIDEVPVSVDVPADIAKAEDYINAKR